MQIAQQLTGVNAFLGYASTLFGQMGITNKLQFNVIWNAIMVFGCVMGLLLVDSRWGGRRIQLLFATVIMFVPMLIGGFSIRYGINGLSMAMVCLYGLGFQLAWGIIPWIYPGELFALAEKDKAVSVAIGFEYAFNAVVLFITPPMIRWGVSNTLFVYGGLNLLNFIFVFACVKETKGVPTEKVPALFGRQQVVHSN